MSQKSLYDFETEQIDKMFDCKNYLFKNSKHEKVILESDTGVKMVRHIIYKPADVSVYQRLALINNPYLCRIYEISESTEAYTIYEEFCDGMTLTDYANGETLTEHDALNITCSISCASVLPSSRSRMQSPSTAAASSGTSLMQRPSSGQTMEKNMKCWAWGPLPFFRNTSAGE